MNKEKMTRISFNKDGTIEITYKIPKNNVKTWLIINELEHLKIYINTTAVIKFFN